MKKIMLSMFMAFFSVFAWADEGMWLMTFIERLKYTDWQKEGLKLTPEEIYSVNQASLKDAIVSFGGYCTGEIISEKGLILTNHHCGYGVIAELSTEENDYLKNGYWAMNTQQELKPEELYVRFLVRMGDLTDEFQKNLSPEMTEAERNETISAMKEEVEKEMSENGKYVVSVKSFFGGNEFYYFVYQDYTDVRFVGAPPSSIGKFGGDTDNWEWPRHTGDFSLFRVYGDKDGNPAEYSPENVPLEPKHFLPIRTTGVKPGDFAMTIGYPGSTERYMPSYGIEQAISTEYPAWVEAAKTAMDAMKMHMDKSDKVRIDYASDYSSIANYWKNRIGMMEALQKLKTIEKKKGYEDELLNWVNSGNQKRKEMYKNVLPDLQAYYKKSNEYVKARTYLVRGLLQGSKMSINPYVIGRMFNAYNEQTDENKSMMFSKMSPDIEKRFETFDLATEIEVMASLLELYQSRVSDKFQPEYLSKLAKEYNYDYKKMVTELAKKSPFTSSEKTLEFFQNGSAEDLSSDPLYQLSDALIKTYMSKPEFMDELEENYAKSYRLYIQGLRETFPNKVFYPDANSTMRLSTGSVKTLPRNPEKPNDAKENYYTTLQGTIAKYVPGDEEFDLPKELIAVYEEGRYKKYMDKDGYMPVCFLTDNDITGGNSGSPVIGGDGALIGLAFDGNWEAMSGDIEFETKLQRTINVDIRYVLLVIDEFAGAGYLLNEMKFVK